MRRVIVRCRGHETSIIDGVLRLRDAVEEIAERSHQRQRVLWRIIN